MAGIYFHIPFCRQACHYCDFHFATSLRHKDAMLAAMQRELRLQKNFLQQLPVSTIYFGGGTPSVCSAGEIESLIDTVRALFPLTTNPEVTIEANPDDLTLQKLNAFRNSSVNRISIGIQSFFDEDLQWMNRTHNGAQAEAALKRTQDTGFDNLTVDLIYGFPLLSTEKWHINLQKLIAFGIPHLSAYNMTVEAKTALAHFIKNGTQLPMDDTQGAQHFQALCDLMKQSGYEHYEISNFAFPNRYARHNSNYWNGIPYLGIGPSAHSFDGVHRQWNIKNNVKYIQVINEGNIPATRETLTETNRLNEYIMTSLRTQWGTDLNLIAQIYGTTRMQSIQLRAQSFLSEELIRNEGDKLILTLKGQLFADGIAAALFDEDR